MSTAARAPVVVGFSDRKQFCQVPHLGTRLREASQRPEARGFQERDFAPDATRRSLLVLSSMLTREPAFET